MDFKDIITKFADIVSDNIHDIAEESLEWLEENYGDGDERFDPYVITEELLEDITGQLPDLPYVDEKAMLRPMVEPIVFAFCDKANEIMDDSGEATDEEE